MLPQERSPEKQAEMARNRQISLLCSRIYKYTALPNLFLMAATIFDSLFSAFTSLLSANPNYFVAYLVTGVLLCPGACAMVILCGYTKNNSLGMYAPGPIAVSLLLDLLLDAGDIGIPLIALIIVLVTVFPVFYANKRYRYLEVQEGFPYFSELLNEQQKKSEELRKTDPYEEAAKKRRLTESSSMNDIMLSGEVIASKENSKNDYMESL